MPAAITDKISKVSSGVRPVSTTVSTIRNSGATTLACADLTGWTTTEVVFFVTYQIDGSGKAKPGTQSDWKGLVSGTNINNLTLTGGADAGNSPNDIVEMLPTAEYAKQLATNILTQHNQDGTHGVISATSVASTGAVSGTTGTFSSDVSDNATTLKTIRAETSFDFVATGGVWSGLVYGSTLTATMTALTAYINGQRGIIASVTTRSFTASKDTYIDVLNTAGVFTLVYSEVTNNAASPALAANSIRIGIIVTGASNIAAAGSVNQGQETMVLPIASSVVYSVTDSLGNLICPRDPNRKLIGFRQVLVDQATASATLIDITGLTITAIVPVGRKIIATGYFPNTYNSTSGSGGTFAITDATNSTNIVAGISRSAIANGEVLVHISKPYTPITYGSLVFKAQFMLATSGAIHVNGAAGMNAAFIKIELV